MLVLDILTMLKSFALMMPVAMPHLQLFHLVSLALLALLQMDWLLFAEELVPYMLVVQQKALAITVPEMQSVLLQLVAVPGALDQSYQPATSMNAILPEVGYNLILV